MLKLNIPTKVIRQAKLTSTKKSSGVAIYHNDFFRTQAPRDKVVHGKDMTSCLVDLLPSKHALSTELQVLFILLCKNN